MKELKKANRYAIVQNVLLHSVVGSIVIDGTEERKQFKHCLLNEKEVKEIIKEMVKNDEFYRVQTIDGKLTAIRLLPIDSKIKRDYENWKL